MATAKFEVHITFQYEVDDEDADLYYGTDDPGAMALIDETNYRKDETTLIEALMSSPEFTVDVKALE